MKKSPYRVSEMEQKWDAQMQKKKKTYMVYIITVVLKFVYIMTH